TIPFSILSLFMLAFFFVFVRHFPSKRECSFARLASRCTAQLDLLAAPRLPRLSVFVRSQHTPHATAPFHQRSKRTQRAVLLQPMLMSRAVFSAPPSLPAAAGHESAAPVSL